MTWKVACISRWMPGSVTVLAPAGEHSTPVRVVPAGSLVASGALTHRDTSFYYGAAVTGVKPQQGPGTGGTRVTISGANFGTARGVVIWNGTPIGVALCPVAPAIPTTGCISKWTPTSIVIVAPPQGLAPTKIALNVIPSAGPAAAISTAIDPHFYYGPLVTAIKL